MVLRIYKIIATRGFLKCTRFVFGRESAPDLIGGLTAPPDPLAGFRGPTSKGRERRERGKGREEREDKGNGGRPPFCKFLDPHLNQFVLFIY